MPKTPKVTITRTQVFEREDGWHMRAKGGNGEVVASGETYTGRSAKKNAEAAARAVAPDVEPEIVPLPKET